MEFESFGAIMNYAIEKEKEAAAFYEDLANGEQFANTKEMFLSFAGEERKHQQMLENFSKENVEEYKAQDITDLKRSDYTVDMEYEPGMAYADILRLAMKREEKAQKFYSDFAGKATQNEHKKLFNMLAQEESKHKLKLETLLDDYLAEMGD